VTISAASSTTRAIFLRAATYFGRCNYDIRRAICENVVVQDSIDVALLTFKLFYAQDTSLSPAQRCQAAETFLRLDAEVVTSILAGQLPPVEVFPDVEIAELFCALCRLTQHAVNFCQPKDISHEFVLRAMLRHSDFVEEVISHFRSRFREGFDTQTSKVAEQLFDSKLDAINDPTNQMVLRKFVELTLQIQRCNLSIPRRRGVAFRIPGKAFENLARGDSPYAVFYVFGFGFDGFHVRFRDVARGGMRLVPTRNREHYLFESSRVFDEAWRLASAQQLKNKDIAEGGAKACVVIKPGNNHAKAGRDFVDGLLDLIIDPLQTAASDSPQLESEYLYLGPDENVSNDLINWIVTRSLERGYRYPSTIMSSKPSAGINHKVYGVTSEGVLVFLRYALIESGINPEQEGFSVKLTGGPDGDVGGNAIKILIRDYKDQVKIVGVSDGTGSACDPSGLEHAELLRLVDEELGIANFSANKLSASGSVMGLDSELEVTRRNQLHNEVVADVFLPAGGRPSTINSTNWQDFLDVEGKPTSKIIIEGANLFLTDPARTNLSEAGVTIVKDSSANKCGVICSSLEIIAGMLLPDEEFIAIKSTYVEEVLELLRELAKTEAISLFNEQLRQPELTLPQISVLISNQIIRVADVINDSFPSWSEEEVRISDQFVESFLPASLVQKISSSLNQKIPANYRRHLISAILSSRIVYREGIQNLTAMTDLNLNKLIRSHVLYENRVNEMISQLWSSELPDKELMMELLDHAGARGQRELRSPIR
jgi:glutamate dehydrogenase